MHSAPGSAASPFCWLDVKTRDVTGVSAFATAVLGWQVAVPPDSPRRSPVLSVAGHEIGGVSDLANPGYPEGLPAHVAYYLAVTDVDRRVDMALARGAELVVGPFDVPGQGRMATLTDPLGAAFSLWQAERFAGWDFPPGLPAAPYRMVLSHPDAARARDFYRTVLEVELASAAFVAEKVDGAPAWEVVLEVDDPETVAVRARSHGEGRVDTGIPGVSSVRLRTHEGIVLHLTRG